MATQVFSAEELERLRGFPEISREELIRFFTLTSGDIEFINPGRGRGQADRLGLAVQLCTLPWLGFVPDDVRAAPPEAIARLADSLQILMMELDQYGSREQTRTDHLGMVTRYLGWRQAGALELAELDEFLLARAMEHDSPTLLFHLACEHLSSSKVVRPGVTTVIEHVAKAREAARKETFDRVAHLLTPKRKEELDRLLLFDESIGATRLSWLGKGPTEATASAVKAELSKLLYLRSLDAHSLDLSNLPAERRRFLAAVGRRLTGQALARREPDRRHPILLTLLSQSAIDVLDEVIQLFDQAMSGRETLARHRLVGQLAERAKAGEDRQALLDDLLAIVTDTSIPDEAIGALVRDERIGWERLKMAVATAPARLPRDHGHLEMLDASYLYMRQFSPEVIEAIDFAGSKNAQPLMEALKVLRELNASGARKVPEGAPTDFVPIRYRGYLEQAARARNPTAYRHYWELTVLLALRDGLRSGDVFVPHSRRYENPAAYLIPPSEWEDERERFCRLVGKPAAADLALAQTDTELRTALADLDKVLASGGGPVRLGKDGELIVPQLTAEDIPAEAKALKSELAALLPLAPIVSLLIELDRRTGFLDCFTHAGGKQARSPELKRNLIAVLVASATNLGLVRMAESCGISYDILAWTAEWYMREETLRAANLAIVGYHQRLPLARIFGGGTLSSSDGQRFPTKGKSMSARALSRYFADEGLSTYTHVTDQHATFGTKIIVATDREAHYVLDEILGNAADIPITEHTTDTHGVTLVNFALFDLVGLQLSPRIRDMDKVTLYRTGPRAEFAAAYPNVGNLLTRRVDAALVAEHWDDFLRLGGSLKFGRATASLIVGKLSRSDRQQNALAAALKEYGALRRTIFAARYLTDEAYRRRITRQLNKGESIHSLRRALHYAHEGAVRRRHLEQQTEQALCLTLVTNAVVAWTTEYYGLAVAEMRDQGRQVEDEVLTHISPAHSENINFFGSITVDVERELAKLDSSGYRPLREREVTSRVAIIDAGERVG